jgi:hypothetical protein
MTEKTLPRPAPVTMAGWVTIVGSVLVVFTVFDVVANLRSLDTRERVRQSLDEPPFEGLGLGLQQVLELLHVLALVAGACAAAAAILGWYVLRRNKQARLALTLVAVPLFLAGIVAGGFLSSMVAVAAVLLWSRPARDWFDGVPPAPRQPPTGTEDPASPPHTGTPGTPPLWQGYGAAPRPPLRTARPGEVLQACLFTWVFGGLVLIGSTIALLGIALDPDVVTNVLESDPRYEDSGLSAGVLRAWVLGSAVLFLLWSLLAVVLAVFVFLGRKGARVALVVSASVAGVLSLVGMLGSPVVVVVTLACGLTVLLLTRPASRAWFVGRP